MKGIGAIASPIHVAIRKDEVTTLPTMGGTDANIMRITGGNYPTRRDVNRLRAICNNRVTVNIVTVQRHIKVGAIALQGVRGGGREEKSVRACVCVQVHIRKLTSMHLLKYSSRPLNALKKMTSTPAALTAS
jgi:hypothetical protein